MPPKVAPPIMDGKPINMEWLAECVSKNEKLMLIKALRFLTAWGLKDSKDEVETQCVAFGTTTLDVQATIDYFGNFIHFGKIPKSPSADQIKTEKVIRGVRCAMKNWSVMGFRSEYIACETVLKNILDR